MPEQRYLEVSGLSKRFGSGSAAVTAIQDVSFSLARGQFLSVLGPSGCGKSTLFNIIAGSFLPDSGRVYLDGRDITKLPDYRRSKEIGRLFQDPLKGTAPNMTIEENLALAYLRASHTKSPFSMVSKADREDFRERLAMLNLGLEDRMKQPVGLLSGGQRQALTLLMATLVTPKILLLDEHTAALDPGTAETVLELTKKIVAENKITCLMITHNLASSLALGNRTIMMAGGHIALDLKNEQREGLTPDDLLRLFRSQGLDNDRILLS